MSAPEGQDPLCEFEDGELGDVDDVTGIAPATAAGGGAGAGAPITKYALPPAPAAQAAGGGGAGGAGGAVADPNPVPGNVGRGTLTHVVGEWMDTSGCEQGDEADGVRGLCRAKMYVMSWLDPLAKAEQMRAMERPTLTAFPGGRAGVLETHSRAENIVRLRAMLQRYLRGNAQAKVRSSRRLFYLGSDLFLGLVERMTTRAAELRGADQGDEEACQALAAALGTFDERRLTESIFRA